MHSTTTMRGGCHCGRLTLEFSTAKQVSDFHPRACDCSFCRKHGAAYISDSDGALTIILREADSLHEYRQGSDTARFLLCRECGVLVGVVFDHESGTYGAVNAGCLDDQSGLGDTISASPQWLSTDEKVSRWTKLWVPHVTFITASREESS
jgi:hypothetical protein